jgi:hypothetical protein
MSARVDPDARFVQAFVQQITGNENAGDCAFDVFSQRNTRNVNNMLLYKLSVRFRTEYLRAMKLNNSESEEEASKVAFAKSYGTVC